MRPYTITTADEALEAAFEARAVTLCPKHKYNLIRTSDLTLTRNAYEIGAAKIDQGLFSSERILLMRAIHDMIELGRDECPCCVKTRTYQAQLASDRNPNKPCPCGSPTCPAFRFV
jgi:hypothetical protein